jgi:KDO2-lipid IV(A) lauroyltransferase
MGTKLVYYLVLLPFSKLPYPILYLLSNFVFFLIYRIIGYRKKVVLKNIQLSFPEKTAKEHHEIMKKFYAHLCDLILESVKCFSLKEQDALKRLIVTNPEVVNHYYDKGKDIILVGGHYNNWEIFAVSMGLQIKHLPIGVYQPLTNKFLDKKMKESREKYRLKMCPMKEVKSVINVDIGESKAPIFAIDQSPSNPNKSYWMNFLNQETSVHFGAEKYAKELDLPVVYGIIEKTKRGYYTVTFKVLCDNPAEQEYGYITQLATRELEKDILNAPQYWLWSHKRWKRKRPEGVELHKDLV